MFDRLADAYGHYEALTEALSFDYLVIYQTLDSLYFVDNYDHFKMESKFESQLRATNLLVIVHHNIEVHSVEASRQSPLYVVVPDCRSDPALS